MFVQIVQYFCNMCFSCLWMQMVVLFYDKIAEQGSELAP